MSITGVEELYVSQGAGRASIPIDEIAAFTKASLGTSVTSVNTKTGDVTLSAADIKALGVSEVAVAAKKLETAHSVSIAGAATAAAVSFDGSADVALTVTAVDATKLTGLVPAASLPAPVLDATKLTGLVPVASLPVATAAALGGVKQAAAQADSAAKDIPALLADFNALLAKLRAAGLLAK